MKYNIVIFMFLAHFVLTLACYGDEQPTTSRQDNGIELKLTLAKSSFLLGEPVLGTVSLTNNSAETLTLVDIMMGSYLGTTAKVVVEPMPKGLVQKHHFPPSLDTLCDFRPGETHTIEIDVQREYQYFLKEGNYTIFAAYTGPNYVAGGAGNVIMTDRLRFSIVAGTGVEADKAKQLFRAQQLPSTPQEQSAAIDVLERLSNQDFGGDLAGYAAFFAVVARHGRTNGEDAAARLLDFIKCYPSLPVYRLQAVRYLAVSALENGDYPQCKQFTLLLPPGAERDKILKRCDLLSARKGGALQK